MSTSFFCYYRSDVDVTPTVWTPLALPTLKLLLPRMRRGTVILADNSLMAKEGYKGFFEFMDGSRSFSRVTLPYEGGFEMCVYLGGGGNA